MNAKTMGQRVLTSRRDLHLDQEELSKQSGVSRSRISEIERGKAPNIGIEAVFSLARALGVSPIYLMGITDNPSGEPDAKILAEQSDQFVVAEVDGADTKQNIRDLIAVYQSLPKSQQTALLGFIRSLRAVEEETQYAVRPPRIIGQ
jgi:transcriptional regulator with XRE-family HTH domain